MTNLLLVVVRVRPSPLPAMSSLVFDNSRVLLIAIEAGRLSRIGALLHTLYSVTRATRANKDRSKILPNGAGGRAASSVLGTVRAMSGEIQKLV